MFVDILLLIVGMALLIKGADFFVDGASKIAKALKIPSLIIGLTLVSMGTSAPELSVSINAALNGSNDISLGNVVGSNIVNTFLILGLSAVFTPLVIGKDIKKYDIPILVGLYVIMLLFGFVITPYKLSLFEAIALFVLFVSYMIHLFVRTKKEGAVEEKEEQPQTKKQIILNGVFVVAGLAAIVFGGDLVVDSAKSIALELGMSETLVGLTIVAVGTSLPELVTSVVAAIKKENDIAVGNVIGSNIFNVLLILGVTSMIHPLTISSVVSLGINEALFDLIALLFSGLVVFIISRISKEVKKSHGIFLVLLYVAYLSFIILRNYL